MFDWREWFSWRNKAVADLPVEIDRYRAFKARLIKETTVMDTNHVMTIGELVERSEKSGLRSGECWVNLYEDGSILFLDSKEDAPSWSGEPVRIRWQEIPSEDT